MRPIDPLQIEIQLKRSKLNLIWETSLFDFARGGKIMIHSRVPSEYKYNNRRNSCCAAAAAAAWYERSNMQVRSRARPRVVVINLNNYSAAGCTCTNNNAKGKYL